MKKIKILILLCFVFLAAGCEGDPLKSWNDTNVKKEIVSYVKKTTNKQSKTFIPKANRIAVFDLDGTLIPEQPSLMEMYMLNGAMELIKASPNLASREPYKTIWETDGAKFPKNMNRKMFADLMTRTQAGASLEAFKIDAAQFFSSAVYPKLDLPLTKIAYKPQLELIKYLQNNGFSVYICSGSEIELIRAISVDLFNIAPDNIIGSTVKYAYDKKNNMIVRALTGVNINNEETKPANIATFIGIIPVFAVGNVRSGGDIHMLRYSQASMYPNMQLMINHDDEAREFAYAEKDNVSLNKAQEYNWHIISMKNDWKDIF